MPSLPSLRDVITDVDRVRLRILDRHPLYREADDERDPVYRHRLTGREVRYDPRENTFEQPGYGGALLQDDTDPAADSDADLYLFAADDLERDELAAALEDSGCSRLGDRAYRTDGVRVWLDDDTLAADHVAVERRDDAADIPARDVLADLDCVGIGKREWYDGGWIRMDPSYDPYKHLNDTFRTEQEPEREQ